MDIHKDIYEEFFYGFLEGAFFGILGGNRPNPICEVLPMPTIVVASPKGGSGKTTTSWLLTTQLAKKGAEVTVIDADPNRPFNDMVEAGNVPSRMTIVSDVDEDNIARKIREAATKTAFVVVDLEGTAAKIVVVALQFANFVVIPMKGSFHDAKAAGKLVSLVHDQEESIRMHAPDYSLPYAVVPCETGSLIETKIMRQLKEGLRERQIPVFDTELIKRQAYVEMLSAQGPLEIMDPAKVSGLEKAIENAEAFAAEVLRRLERGTVKDPVLKVAAS
ncbi:ParA family protein [Caballeronia sp. AZ7_KS35]|uniref:AAA family ATPase n=1 Tax=Caballeronia sp. AZ7_KS35 TaxID=2921762 RepID=UPI0020282841